MSELMPNNSKEFSRRTFLKSSAVAAAGLSVADYGFAAPKTETLAISGGPKAVSVPAEVQTALTRWPRYGEAEKQRLVQLLDSNQFYEELALFENEWKAYTKSPFVKAHMNGTSALTSMYSALDLPAGSEIMVPSKTFFATCLSMRFFGYVPIFIDIDPKTGCFDLEDAKRKLTARTKALVVMHTWGMPCEMDRISEWTKEKGLILLEDAAHAHGAEMQGRKMGTWGVMGIYSYQASKVMPCIEGGMGMYQTRQYFERATTFGHYDTPAKFPEDSPMRAYEGTGFGQKYRMHPLAAALARQQLKGLDQHNAIVEKNIRATNDRLTQLPGITEPHCRKDQKRVYYNGNVLYVDFNELGCSRESLIKTLNAEGVRVRFWQYPEQHKLKIYSEAKWWHHAPKIPESMPGNDKVNACHISLPLLYEDAPELIAQYVSAFEKVWAHKTQLAKV